MKVLSLIVLIFSSSAFATKARLTALGNSFQLRSTQSVYTSPYHLATMSDFVSYESGLTTATSSNNGAEGAATISVGENARLLFALGHIDESIQNPRTFINSLPGFTFKSQQNPVQLIYAWKDGDSTYGVGTFYSHLNNKTLGAEEKESSTGLRLSGSHDAFAWRANLGLTNKVETLTGTFDGANYLNAALRYNVGDSKYALDFTTWDAKVSTTTAITQNHNFQNINLRYVEEIKNDNGMMFCSAGINQTNIKNKNLDKKFTRLLLPLLMGFETKGTEWLTLRGSVTQTFLVAQSKDEVGYPAAISPGNGTVDSEFAAEANNTAVAVGAGLNFGKLTLDGTLKDLVGSTAGQKIDGSNLFAQVGLVYNY